MSLPLTGLLVVSLEHAVAAPLCTARLADAGARVIKVERKGGDFARCYDTAAAGDSSYFAWINHGKESIVLDFKQSEDAALLNKMISQADVVVQNLAPGALSRAGFGLDDLRQRYPGLVTCNISGYGGGEAVQNMKAYDLLVQAESGLISISGGPGEPGRIGVSLCDIGAGVTAYTGILEALLRRSLTRAGGHVDVSLFSVAAEWMSVPFLHTVQSGSSPQRVGLKHPTIAPYGAFPDASGTLTLIAIQNEREWQRLCLQVLNSDALYSDERYRSNDLRVDNRDDLDAELARMTGTMSTSQFRSALQSASIAFGALNNVSDLLDHAALVRRQIRNSHGVLLSMPAHPVTHTTEGVDSALISCVPGIDEQGDAIRREFNTPTD